MTQYTSYVIQSYTQRTQGTCTDHHRYDRYPTQAGSLQYLDLAGPTRAKQRVCKACSTIKPHFGTHVRTTFILHKTNKKQPREISPQYCKPFTYLPLSGSHSQYYGGTLKIGPKVFVKKGKYIVFCMSRRSYLVWSPVKFQRGSKNPSLKHDDNIYVFV